MARRSDHSRDELVQLIIDTGHELISEQGIKNFSARAVANKIGYSVGTLYHVFGSYDHLMTHINAKTLDHWYEAMMAALAQEDNLSLIHRLARFYLQYSEQHQQSWLGLFEYHASPDYEIPLWYQEKLQRFFQQLETAIAPNLQDEASIKQTAKILWAGIHGITILALSGKLAITGASSPEAMAFALVEGYLAGVP
ncbi:MAG: TetR/AcrR family transcriptional regulator [Alphaproteobacteria bacterium]